MSVPSPPVPGDEAPAAPESIMSELARQLEDDPEGVWLALQGIESVEPAARRAIIARLAGQPLRPGLVELLRLLSCAEDAPTRSTALAALRGMPPGLLPPPARPRLAGSLVTALDEQGRGFVVLWSVRRDTWAAAAFTCDAFAGIVAVRGTLARDEIQARSFAAAFATRPDLDVIEDQHELALNLLAGSFLLGGRVPAPTLRYWIDQTAGADLQPRPFAERNPDRHPSGLTHAAAEALLDTCPSWLDRSTLTFELAEEIQLREPGSPPDPARDAGLARFLFERRFLDRVELDRRRLTWMAAFWHASAPADWRTRHGRRPRSSGRLRTSSPATRSTRRWRCAAWPQPSIICEAAAPSRSDLRTTSAAGPRGTRSRPAADGVSTRAHFFLPADFSAPFFSVAFLPFSLSFGALSPMSARSPRKG